MTALRMPAHAKLNVFLRVLGRRDDGYHDIETLLLPISLADHVTVEPADQLTLSLVGPATAGVPEDEANLVLRVARVLAADAGGASPPGARITVEKRIPVTAGLGGGSADAAATLRALCRFAGLDSSSRAVQELAGSLGADVPVCLASSPARMRGIGELIEPLPDFPRLNVVLANAGPAVSTAEVFVAVGLNPGETGHPSLTFPFAFETSRNDLTPAAVKRVPVIAAVLDALKALTGVRFARMSGSGGTCFAVFDTIADAERAAAELASRHPDWWIRRALLS